jgi:hypothetical protein
VAPGSPQAKETAPSNAPIASTAATTVYARPLLVPSLLLSAFYADG